MVGEVQSMVVLTFSDLDNPELDPLAMPLPIRPGDESEFEQLFKDITDQHCPDRYSLEFVLFLSGTDLYESPQDTVTIGLRDMGGSIVHSTWVRSELIQGLTKSEKDNKYHLQWLPANDKTYKLLPLEQKNSYDFINRIVGDYFMAVSAHGLEHE